MEKKIITINKEKCTGCELCISACLHSSLSIIDGKAQLSNDQYCSCFDDCLPSCPRDAITIQTILLPEPIIDNNTHFITSNNSSTAHLSQTPANAQPISTLPTHPDHLIH